MNQIYASIEMKGLQRIDCIYNLQSKSGKKGKNGKIKAIKFTGKEMLLVIQLFPIVLEQYVFF